jgi:predicted AlkP superfamily phosphohydrolase/phosphomutase
LKPGRHGIFDFLKRDPDTYRPQLALVTEGSKTFLWGERTPMVVGVGLALALALVLILLLKLFRLKTRTAAIIGLVLGISAGVASGLAASRLLPTEIPTATNPRQGDTFWQLMGREGKRVRVVRLPQNFPPEPFENGELLSGLGTPDLSFRIGKPFYFTSELFFNGRGGGDFSVEVVELVDNRGSIETEIKGPPDRLFSEPGKLRYINLPMTLDVAEDRQSLGIKVSDQELTMKPGEWSDWVRFTFPINAAIKLNGIGRFRLLSVEPEVRLYLSPIQFDPERLPPIVDITAPREFADDLTDDFGLFKTIGWAVDTWSFDEGTIEEDVFLEDVRNTVAKFEEMLYGTLEQSDEWDVLVHYFEFTDRVQHMMWRLFDEGHPGYDAEQAALYGGAILDSYQTMDRIVGEVIRRMPEGTRLFVSSDHGFASFRWGMNYNTWLVKNGYMTLNGEDAERKNLEDLFDQGDFFVNVDWSRTRAYALGLGNIYINLEGRENQGIVKPGEEYEALRAELQEKLVAYVDENTGLHPVAHVFTREEAHGVFDPLIIPDLIPSNSDGYRVGWQDTLGGIGKTVVEPNTQYWSGDHCSVYPPLVDGILFSNVKLDAERPYIGDIMPTVLELNGVPVPEGLDGKSLLP